MKKFKDEILKFSLELVPEFGWSEEALEKANKKALKDEEGANVVFLDVKELVAYFLENTDERMLQELKKTNIEPLKIRQRIRKALVVRFKINSKEIIKKTMSFLAKPQNADLAFKSLAKTCDEIWKWAGDESTDFNYYTKRALLGSVYSIVVLRYVQKDEMDLEDLSIFIENSLDKVLKIGGLKNKLSEAASFVKKFAG
jgi:ubiquinone biosynthesis protein COQ9